MPDISMCRNSGCKASTYCYRFQATPSQRQSYASFAPDKEGKCEHFVPTSYLRSERILQIAKEKGLPVETLVLQMDENDPEYWSPFPTKRKGEQQ